MLDIEAPSVDSARMRRAGRELLSLALMDSRNHTLRWIGAFEQALSSAARSVPPARAAIMVSTVEKASTATCPTNTGQASGAMRRALSARRVISWLRDAEAKLGRQRWRAALC